MITVKKNTLLHHHSLHSDLGVLELVQDGLHLLDLGIPGDLLDGFPPHLCDKKKSESAVYHVVEHDNNIVTAL